MTDETPRDELHEFLDSSRSSPHHSVIKGELAPCTAEEFAAGLHAAGWRRRHTFS